MNQTTNHQAANGVGASAAGQSQVFQVETFSSFPVQQTKSFDINLANHIKQSDLFVSITNPILGAIDNQLDWIHLPAPSQTSHNNNNNNTNTCRCSFKAPIVGSYLVSVELANRPQHKAEFQAKAYDLAKVLIGCSTERRCVVNESFEFSVDASEAGEGQLEIAVNEGEIPNQVQVLDNGKCIVNFVPEEAIQHVVDIKFNGHNVNGCPFVVEVDRQQHQRNGSYTQKSVAIPTLSKEERILVDSVASFSLKNVADLVEQLDESDIQIIDPENQSVRYSIKKDVVSQGYKFEFTPPSVGDYNIELVPRSLLASRLPAHLLEQFPFSLKVFDFRKVIVSNVTDGVIGHPIYFFIDASQAGSGNLEIKVSSKTRTVPNYPQSESNARIRVYFTPTEAVDHHIDVNFNGFPVPGNPFLVKVAQFPQARLPVTSQDVLKYVAINEDITFYVDYIGGVGSKDATGRTSKTSLANHISATSCQVNVLTPDFAYTKLEDVELIRVVSDKSEKQQQQQPKFKIIFKPTRIGPHKLFITVNNELLPSSPIVSNVYNINEVRVSFEQTSKSVRNVSDEPAKIVGILNQPVTFTVDASRAGEGTLALAVISGLSQSLVTTDVKVSEKGHGLYNLTFVPTEFAAHSIDMSFNERVVPDSPFIVDILDANGRSSSASEQNKKAKAAGPKELNDQKVGATAENSTTSDIRRMVQNFESMNLKQQGGSSTNQAISTNGKSKIPYSSMAATQTSSSGSSSSSRTRKSLAFGLVNSSNVIYLESGVLENPKSQVSLLGPNDERVPFNLGKGSPQAGEPKKSFIEYEPKAIGTHTINVLDGGKELRQYFVEICDPARIRITDLKPDNYSVGRPVSFCLDSRDSGDIQLDSITITGPQRSSSSGSSHKNRDANDQQSTILSKIKSISSPTTQQQQHDTLIEYSLTRLNDFKQVVEFVPQFAGKYCIDIRCLGQPVGSSPFEISVATNQYPTEPVVEQQQQTNSNTMGKNRNQQQKQQQQQLSREEELLANIVVHGISLKCSPVNSTGAFIIETNRSAHAQDFDVLITDPANNLVDVQCYLQQDGNLLAEWTPRRIANAATGAKGWLLTCAGTHKIEVLYKDKQVPGSPFMTEAFDPSGVLIKDIKTTHCSVNDTIQFKLDRRDAGYGELDVAITSPVGQDLPINVHPIEDDENEVGELISFTPTVAGKYKLSITFGGYEVPKSPITFTASMQNTGKSGTALADVRASGAGLRCSEVNRSAQFLVESSQEVGELKLRIELGNREIVPKVEKRANTYTIKYKPTEVGYANISLYWNGAHLADSPFTVPVNDLSKILFLSGTNKSSNNNNQRIVDFEPEIGREITLDTSKCGPGKLRAEAYCRANPSIKFSVPTEEYAQNRYKVLFECPPRAEQLAKGISIRDISIEATYLIRFYFNNLAVPETLASVVLSPIGGVGAQPAGNGNGIQKQAVSGTAAVMETHNNSKHNDVPISKKTSIQPETITATSNPIRRVECPVVALRGHGLMEAKCGQTAEFTIDGTEAGSGEPEVKLIGGQDGGDEVDVHLEKIGPKLHRASYVARNAGAYTLNVLWAGKQVAGCPVTVNVSSGCDPSKVICTGDGLKGGMLGEEIKVFIDTRRAGSGELTALCTGPQKVAFCELLDRGDGTFILYVKPQEPGRQFLTIKYAGQHIPKSPFLIKISGRPDPTKVRVYGPGVEHGVLSLYQSRFVCDTRGAGAGQLTVRIRGPKGAFRMETQRESQRDRTILCKYDPTEPGDYRIEIKWSGHHVPGSPFSVMIFDTQEELNRFLISGQSGVGGGSRLVEKMVTGPMAPAFHAPPTLADYGHYSKTMAPPTGQPQPPYRL